MSSRLLSIFNFFSSHSSLDPAFSFGYRRIGGETAPTIALFGLRSSSRFSSSHSERRTKRRTAPENSRSQFRRGIAEGRNAAARASAASRSRRSHGGGAAAASVVVDLLFLCCCSLLRRPSLPLLARERPQGPSWRKASSAIGRCGRLLGRRRRAPQRWRRLFRSFVAVVGVVGGGGGSERKRRGTFSPRKKRRNRGARLGPSRFSLRQRRPRWRRESQQQRPRMGAATVKVILPPSRPGALSYFFRLCLFPPFPFFRCIAAFCCYSLSLSLRIHFS